VFKIRIASFHCIESRMFIWKRKLFRLFHPFFCINCKHEANEMYCLFGQEILLKSFQNLNGNATSYRGCICRSNYQSSWFDDNVMTMKTKIDPYITLFGSDDVGVHVTIVFPSSLEFLKIIIHKLNCSELKVYIFK
jgi:hypothetical protein